MIVNLCFHGIGTCGTEREPGEASYWVREKLFLEVLDQVVDRPHVRLSFDDGNVSDVTTALPALQERGLRATFFPLAGRLEDPVSLAPSHLRELREAGMSVGSHGWRHVPWQRLSAADAHRELVEARTTLEDAVGCEITEAALPLGRYDRRALRDARRARYGTVYTSDRFPARPRSWLQARYSVTASDTLTSVLGAVDGRPGRRELRNVAASFVKRIL